MARAQGVDVDSHPSDLAAYPVAVNRDRTPPEIQKELWKALQAKCEKHPEVAIHSYNVEHLHDRGSFAVWFGHEETFRLSNGTTITIRSHGGGEDMDLLSHRIDKAAKKARKRVKLKKPKTHSSKRARR